MELNTGKLESLVAAEKSTLNAERNIHNKYSVNRLLTQAFLDGCKWQRNNSNQNDRKPLEEAIAVLYEVHRRNTGWRLKVSRVLFKLGRIG